MLKWIASIVYQSKIMYIQYKIIHRLRTPKGGRDTHRKVGTPYTPPPTRAHVLPLHLREFEMNLKKRIRV
jgi:hypothetical protein